MNRKSILVSALLLVVVTASALYAAEGDRYTVLDASSLRDGPDSAYAAVATLSAGDQVTEVARKGDWIKVRAAAGKADGWLYAATVERLPVAATAIADTAQSPAVTVGADIDKAAPAIVTAPAAAPATMLWDDAVFGRRDVASAANSAQPQPPLQEKTVPVAAVSASTTTNDSSEPVATMTPGESAATLDMVAHDRMQTVMAADVLGADQPAMKTAAVQEPVQQTRQMVVGDHMAVADQAPPVDVVTSSSEEPAVVTATVEPVEQPVPVEPAVMSSPPGLEVVGDGSGQQIALAEMPVEPVIVPAPTASSAEVDLPVEPQAAVAEPTEPPAVSNTAEPVAPTENQYRFNRNAILRAGPDAKFDIVGWGGVDASASELDRKGDWIKIQMQISKRIGWVYSPSLTLTQAALASAASTVADGEPAAVESGSVAVFPLPAADQAAIGEAAIPSTADQVNSDQMAATDQTAITTGEAPVTPVTDQANGDQTATTDQATAAGDSTPSVMAEPVADHATAAAGQVGATSATVPQQSLPANVSANPRMQQFAPDSEHAILRTTTIRSGPGVLSDVLGWAGKGATVVALAQQGAWLKVRMLESGRIGWIESASLQTGSPAVVATAVPQPVAATPVEGKAPEPAAPEPEVIALKPVEQASEKTVVTSEHLSQDKNLYRFNRKSKLRAGPDERFDIVGWGGIDAYASELDRKGGWIKIQMQVSKRIGWVYQTSLMLAKAGAIAPASAQPVLLKADSAAQPVLATTSLANPDQLYFFSQTNDLLAGPGRQFDRVGWVGRNESATIIDSKGDWRRINMTISGKRGWVPANLLLVALATGPVTVADAKPATDSKTPVVLPEPLQAKVLKTATLRTQAGIDSNMTGWVAKGDMVTVLRKQGGWAEVNPDLAGKQAGWIRADYLREIEPMGTVVNRIGGNQPISTYGNRISHGEAFNFSYAALEQALYRVPIEEIELTIAEDDLKALFRKDLYDQSAFPIDILQDKRKLNGTVQALGSSTRVFRKKSLRIKLDADGGRWFGRRNIALRSMGSDKAMMREWISWKMMEAMGMKVPEVHFTRVRFNHGEKVALYLSVEWMGKEFFTSNGLDPNGEFFQPNDAAHCGDLYTAENMDICFDKLTPEDADYSSISTMAKAMIAASAEDMDRVLAEYFDDETVLNWITANALVTNGDTYNKNYWLYHQPNGGKWTMVPWDYNLTLGRTYDPYAVTPFTIFNENFQYFYAPDVGAGNPLKDKALRNAKLRARIEAKIKHLIGMEPNGPEETFGWFSPTVMEARIGNLAAVIGKEVYKDTFLSYGEEDFTKTFESMMHYTKAHDYFLKNKLFGRLDWTPEPPNQPLTEFPLPEELVVQGEIKAGADHLHMVDSGWGYFVADLNLDQPMKSDGKFKVIVEGGAAPRYLPPTRIGSRCIKRSWVVSAETPASSVHADLMFEYIQENSHRTEVPQTLHEELLELWVQEDNHWKPLKTDANQYSNTLTTRGVDLKYGQDRRFVACSPF
ncbi:MAG: hypothetical protein COW18_04980 [Zetaproteobacteria bacterium CG12_big_fil_rev_8_21_14_0_65_54_13]|nr:MAG: hypothetical protein COW18_04980 [Zetaproteobacteria bacterium CG12_big_fil_rev_8_21_14_0_65_54_13]PIX55485.1 MAG: hypothetical protein COZ50_02485 [Zetaproteobacteria bacterium CG_4_10_14_3_um_filter_54_28]PJA27416.1 MAG: hypothetical protein CO188_12460 [Zetaproteobacteria bacterium CG_4_9_14_3_um_filter_54_145]